MEHETPPHRVRLLDVVVVLLCLIGLAALVLPALLSTRHGPSRRAMCRNNLKNISLSLQNYHETYRMFPAGATHAGDPENPRVGPSWWYAALPFCELRNLYDKIALTQDAEFHPSGVAFTYAEMPDTQAHPIQDRLRRVHPDYMRCPVSPLPTMEARSGYILMPSYVGISGGCDIDSKSTDFDGCPDKPETQMMYKNPKKGTGPSGSIVTSSGMLPPNEQINVAKCTDGTSYTMIVSEQSDFLRNVILNVSTSYHGDPGWNPPSDKNPGGWLSGTDVVDPVGPANGLPTRHDPTAWRTASSTPGDWHADLLLNIATVRYRPDLKQVIGDKGQESLPGCAEAMGHNNPLQSPHPGGLLVTLVDGSVQFVTATVDLGVLLRLAIRDDSQNVKLD